jgi:hypothetical protein
VQSGSLMLYFQVLFLSGQAVYNVLTGSVYRFISSVYRFIYISVRVHIHQCRCSYHQCTCSYTGYTCLQVLGNCFVTDQKLNNVDIVYMFSLHFLSSQVYRLQFGMLLIVNKLNNCTFYTGMLLNFSCLIRNSIA